MTTPIPPESRPGVFISESIVPLSGNNSVPGEAVGCFAAAYNRGPTVPTFVSSWSQYTQLYGNFNVVTGTNYLPYAVYQYFNNGGSGCFVLGIPNTDATTASLVLVDVNSPTDNVITVNAISPGAWGNNVYVSVQTAGNPGRFNLAVFNGGNASSNLVENWIDLSINPTDPRNVANIVNSTISGSNYVTVNVTLPGPYTLGVDDPAFINPTLLSGGGDGVSAPVLSTAIPLQLDKLQGQILNLNVPGVTDPTTLNTLIAWAAGRGDVMMVIDGPAPNFPETSATVANNYVNMVSGGNPLSSSTYASLYAPWVLATDPASSMPGSTIWLPPGGAVLGIWSATDNAVGPWQAAAGISYGQINIVDIEARFTSTDLDTLNQNNINAIRFVPGYFPAVMGARTLQQGYPSRYIPVRRELMQLEHDFTFLLQFALFEPNDQTLWNQVEQVLTNYLTQAMQQGAIAGNTVDDAFSVTCDSSNNLPATVQAGIVNCSVAVSLNSPAEFILISISQFQNTGVTSTTTSVS